MDRKSFTQKLTLMGVCPFLLHGLTNSGTSGIITEKDEKVEELRYKKEFVENWLADLLDSIDKNLDRNTQEQIVGYCGKACFNRYQFKKDIAAFGSGDLDKLIESYKKYFEIWKDGDIVHIRFGEVSEICYCPAANYRDTKPNDIHCECTRNTHKAIFETALGRPFRVDVVETLRRGGKTCHFIVHLS